MQLLVVRHAIAAPRGSFSGPDGARRLTDEGRKRMGRAAQALRELVPRLDRIATSPLLRAVETAEILSEAYGGLETLETACLAPGADVRELAKWLASSESSDTLAVVGHEPDLSAAVSWFTAGVEGSCMELGKGGAALLDFPGSIGAARATLLWLLRPGQLRRLV